MSDPWLVIAIALVAFFAGACLSYAFLFVDRDSHRWRRW